MSARRRRNQPDDGFDLPEENGEFAEYETADDLFSGNGSGEAYPELVEKQDYIKKPPIWCSVDLRDGNQSLVIPMSIKDTYIGSLMRYQPWDFFIDSSPTHAPVGVKNGKRLP